MKKIALMLVCIIMVLTVSGCSKYVNDHNSETYDHMADADDIMPRTDEIGAYTEVYTSKNTYNYAYPIFMSDTYILIAKYDEGEYESQKALINDKYSFDSTMVNPSPSFDLDGFHFGLLSSDNTDYPKELYFIGFNDTDRAISYIYFYDQDLNVIDQPFDEFLREYSDWNYGSGSK